MLKSFNKHELYHFKSFVTILNNLELMNASHNLNWILHGACKVKINTYIYQVPISSLLSADTFLFFLTFPLV